MRLGYGNGPLNVALRYGTAKGGTAADPVDYKTLNLGASYNFGVVTPMVLIASRKRRGNNQHVDLYSVGVKAPVGPGEVRAAVSWYKDKKRNERDSVRLALGYGYKLSKRTELYATVAHMSNDDNATRKLGTSLAHAVAAGKNATGYELGLRHNSNPLIAALGAATLLFLLTRRRLRNVFAAVFMCALLKRALWPGGTVRNLLPMRVSADSGTGRLLLRSVQCLEKAPKAACPRPVMILTMLISAMLRSPRSTPPYSCGQCRIRRQRPLARNLVPCASPVTVRPNAMSTGGFFFRLEELWPCDGYFLFTAKNTTDRDRYTF